MFLFKFVECMQEVCYYVRMTHVNMASPFTVIFPLCMVKGFTCTVQGREGKMYNGKMYNARILWSNAMWYIYF